MRGRLKIKVFIILISILGIEEVWSQSNNIHEQLTFKYLNVDNGLTNNRVRGMAQDNYGFIWLGTRKGVSRFNGYRIDQYYNFIDGNDTLYFNETSDILCDSRSNLWVTGSYGVCLFNWDKNTFYRFQHKDLTVNISNSGGVDEDSQGNIWLTTNVGLIKFDTKADEISIIEQKNDNPLCLPEGSLVKLMVDSRDNIWFSVDRHGAGFVNQKNNKIYNFIQGEDKNTLAGNRVERFYEDKEGNVWIGHYNNGVTKYLFKKKKLERYYPEEGVKEAGRVRGIVEDAKGNFWFGTQAGLYLFNKKDTSFFRYAYAEHPVSILGHNSIQNMIVDKQEGLWLGTYAGGVSYTNLNRSGFVKYENSNIPSPYFLNDKSVYSLAFDKKDNIWIGTENGGLNYLDKSTGKYTVYNIIPGDKNCPLSNNIKDIEVDGKNNIWFGTYRGGLSHFNTKTKKFINYLKTEENPYGLEKETVYSLFFDISDSNYLWIGAIEGLYLMDIKNETFTRVKKGIAGFVNVPEIEARVFTIYGENNKMYFGSDKLIVLNVISKEFRSYESINGVSVSQIDFVNVDKKGIVWFGLNSTYLVRFEQEKNIFRFYGEKDGLPVTEYLEAEDDIYNNLWISSSKGIIKLEGIINDPDSFKIRTYDNSDNLQSLEFIYHSKAESKSGEILFGGINGFNSFRPNNVRINPYKPEVAITDLVIANKVVRVGQEVYGKKILNKYMIETDDLKFHHKIKTFTFRFTAFHFVAPENNKFQYMLEGYDDHWNETDASVRFASYSNLKRGTYVFKLKASNNNGLWMEIPKEITLKITPPFWKTVWFYMLVFVIILIGVWQFIRWRESQINKDKEILEEQLKKGEAEINKNKAEVAKKADEIRKRDLAEKEQKWHNNGIIKIGEIITEHKNEIETLGDSFLVELINYMDCMQGAIAILNENNNEDRYLELLSGHALSKERFNVKRIEIGENLIGSCFKDNRTMLLSDIPDGYANVESGIGGTSSKFLLITPLRYNEKVLGVLELSSLNEIQEYKVKFIEIISEMFAANIFTSITNGKMNELLEQSQQQAEELHAQEEEMRQNIEEMRATQDEASRKEQELIIQNQTLIEKESKLIEMVEKQKNELKKLKTK